MRGKALRPWKVREAVARGLARAGVPLYADGARAKASGGVAANALLWGWPDDEHDACTFDVHAAREHALELVRSYADNDHARNRCELGLRILSALEGQPSECQACGGCGEPSDEDCRMWWNESGRWDPDSQPPEVCPDCQGTGHNLRGVLPPVEVSPQLRRKVTDANNASSDDSLPDDWTEWSGAPLMDSPTRVTPRGEHRPTGAWPSAAEAHRRAPKGSELRRAALDMLVSERLWDCRSSPDDYSHWPKWARGEQLHAQQRRERENHA